MPSANATAAAGGSLSALGGSDLLKASPDVLVLAIVLILWAIPFTYTQFSSRRGVKNAQASKSKPDEPSSGYLLQSAVHHARFLPLQSKHQFKYSTLYTAIELKALEGGKLDHGRIFCWNGKLKADGSVDAKAAVTALRPDNYLRLAFPELDHDDSADRAELRKQRAHQVRSSVLLKLAYELRHQGFTPKGPQDLDADAHAWRETGGIGNIWAITMPSYLGFNGINPLTTYFVYKKGDSGKEALWLVVLEVHNTFSERHVYVHETGKKEDPAKELRLGYDHQWTFPRAFHVSPFNDRGGFYRLHVRDLFGKGSIDGKPDLDIRLLLLVHGEDEGEKSNDSNNIGALRKKLLATLTCHANSDTPAHGIPALPLTSANLTLAIARQPLTLFLTFPRILYEAGRLHFQRRLDAFGRPDMQEKSVPQAAKQEYWDGVGWPPSLNPIEAAPPKGEGILWPKASWAETVCKDRLLDFAQRRVELDPSLSLRVRFADPALQDIVIENNTSTAAKRELVVFTRSFGFFTDMLLWPEASTALLVGSKTTRRWGVNDIDLFQQFFKSSQGGLAAAQVGRISESASQRVRQRFWKWAASNCEKAKAIAEAVQDFARRTQGSNIQHWSDSQDAQPGDRKLSWALWQLVVAAEAEKWLFQRLGARYVIGTEPWLELERALKLQAEEQPLNAIKPKYDTKVGSAARYL